MPSRTFGGSINGGGNFWRQRRHAPLQTDQLRYFRSDYQRLLLLRGLRGCGSGAEARQAPQKAALSPHGGRHVSARAPKLGNCSSNPKFSVREQ